MTQLPKSRKNSRISIKVHFLSLREENRWFDWSWPKATPFAMQPINLALNLQLPNKSWRNTRRQGRSFARLWINRKQPTTPPPNPSPNIFPQIPLKKTFKDPSNTLKLLIWLNRWECSMKAFLCSRLTFNG